MSQQKSAVPAIAPPRIAYHPAVEQRFGVDQASWRVLVESTFPNAKTADSVILALAYCKARKLDPFKRVVHIVPIYDKERHTWTETVWPGIAEHRTTAFRTGSYAGKDPTSFGPDMDREFADEHSVVCVTFPLWAQVTVYRTHNGQRVAFPGPRVYWMETFASVKSGAPNSMWRKRPYGQLEKCAEAAALRAAFPEELGDEWTAEEAEGGWSFHGRPAIDVKPQAEAIEYPSRSDAIAAQIDAMKPAEPEKEPAPVAESDEGVSPLEEFAMELDTLTDPEQIADLLARAEEDQRLSAADKAKLVKLAARK